MWSLLVAVVTPETDVAVADLPCFSVSIRCSMLSGVDVSGAGVQSARVGNDDAVLDLAVRVERVRGDLKVVAAGQPGGELLSVEVTFSGGPRGMWFQIDRGGRSQLFTHPTIAEHPALSAVLRLIGDEVDLLKAGANSKSLLAFLFRSLLIYVGRMSTAVPRPNWGRPIRDKRIERALELLNSDIQKRWTVELLARAVGLSRAVFARQFSRILGLSPIRYLTQERMRTAAALLLTTDATLPEVAAQVGYQSEFAFSRAFKRQYRVPPSEYRKQPRIQPRAVLLAA